MDIKVIGTIFNERNQFGDFFHMIKSGNYSDALFIYNDNEESYYDKSYQRGAGNACIRIFNMYNKKYEDNPMSAGIPTGTLEYGGYEEFNEERGQIIDNCINQIVTIIKKHNKKRLFYSAKDMTGILGNGIFRINEGILKLITNKIHKLTLHNITIVKSILNNTFDPVIDDCSCSLENEEDKCNNDNIDTNN